MMKNSSSEMVQYHHSKLNKESNPSYSDEDLFSDSDDDEESHQTIIESKSTHTARQADPISLKPEELQRRPGSQLEEASQAA